MTASCFSTRRVVYIGHSGSPETGSTPLRAEGRAKSWSTVSSQHRFGHRRLPVGAIVLVDQQRADALDEIVASARPGSRAHIRRASRPRNSRARRLRRAGAARPCTTAGSCCEASPARTEPSRCLPPRAPAIISSSVSEANRRAMSACSARSARSGGSAREIAARHLAARPGLRRAGRPGRAARPAAHNGWRGRGSGIRPRRAGRRSAP